MVEVAARSYSMRCRLEYMAAMVGPAGVDAIHCNSRAAFCSSLKAVLYSGCFQQVMGLYAPREWSAATKSAATPQKAIVAPAQARLASRNQLWTVSASYSSSACSAIVIGTYSPGYCIDPQRRSRTLISSQCSSESASCF